MESQLGKFSVEDVVQHHGTGSFFIPMHTPLTDGRHNGCRSKICFTPKDLFKIVEFNSMQNGKKRATLQCFSPRKAPKFQNIDSIHVMVDDLATDFVIVQPPNLNSYLTDGMQHIFQQSRIRSICALHLKNDILEQKHHKINGAILLVIDTTDSHFTCKLNEASNEPPLIFTLHKLNAGLFCAADDIHAQVFDAQPAQTKSILGDQLFCIQQTITDQSGQLLDQVKQSVAAVLTAQETERQKELAARDVQDNKNKRQLEEKDSIISSLKNQLKDAQMGLLTADEDWTPMNKIMYYEGHMHEFQRKKAALEREHYKDRDNSAGVDINAKEAAGASSHEAAGHARNQKRVKTEDADVRVKREK